MLEKIGKYLLSLKRSRFVLEKVQYYMIKEELLIHFNNGISCGEIGTLLQNWMCQRTYYNYKKKKKILARGLHRMIQREVRFVYLYLLFITSTRHFLGLLM